MELDFVKSDKIKIFLCDYPLFGTIFVNWINYPIKYAAPNKRLELSLCLVRRKSVSNENI